MLLLLKSGDTSIKPIAHRQSFSATVYSDHFERHVGRASNASHTIGYASSVDVATVEYGNRSRRCQYMFSNFTLTRHFSYDILHQPPPYGVRHMQLGSRTWVRGFPAANGDVKGPCPAAIAKVVIPAAAAANTLGSWKDVIDQDDAVVRHFLSGDKPKGR